VQIDGRIEKPRNVRSEFSFHDGIPANMHRCRRRSLLNRLDWTRESAGTRHRLQRAEKQLDGAGRAVFSSQLWVT
jgi:hypothetical protein